MTSGPNSIADATKLLPSLPADSGLALLFPGQGSQKAGMGLEAYRASAAARAVYETADRALDTGLSRLCFEGPDSELTRTANAQPAILATSLALLVAAVDSGTLERRPAFLAGHSLGEYTALVAAGSLRFEDALRLVCERGRLMEEAGAENPGTMAAIVGLTGEEVADICRLSGAQLCNFNARTQVVVGGEFDRVQSACALAKERGGRGLPMKVAAAFHTSLMDKAARDFATALEAVTADDPAIPVMSNVTAAPMESADELMSDLARQMAMPVLWHQSVLRMMGAGVSAFAELGPGRALTAMLKRDAPELTLISLDDAALTTSASHV